MPIALTCRSSEKANLPEEAAARAASDGVQAKGESFGPGQLLVEGIRHQLR